MCKCKYSKNDLTFIQAWESTETEEPNRNEVEDKKKDKISPYFSYEWKTKTTKRFGKYGITIISIIFMIVYWIVGLYHE